VRLDTLNTNKPAPRFGGRIAQTKLSTAATAPPPLQAPASKDEECRHPNLSEHGNSKICDECGAVVEDSEIVAEITFGETSSGAAVVQGGFVGEGQRHANTMGGTVRGMPGRESRQKTQQRGWFF
jgi:transcription factor IIIB subunit 2